MLLTLIFPALTLSTPVLSTLHQLLVLSSVAESKVQQQLLSGQIVL